jgi:Family of unknown function (DUF6165)
MTKVHIPVSLGELVDKITILEIKRSMISDEAKLRNVLRELEQLEHIWSISKLDRRLIDSQWAQLRAINEGLWHIEDRKRLKEASASFDQEFIALARSVYFENDKRAAVKRKINEILGSDIVEEKSYANYQAGGQAPPRI